MPPGVVGPRRRRRSSRAPARCARRQLAASIAGGSSRRRRHGDVGAVAGRALGVGLRAQVARRPASAGRRRSSAATRIARVPLAAEHVGVGPDPRAPTAPSARDRRLGRRQAASPCGRTSTPAGRPATSSAPSCAMASTYGRPRRHDEWGPLPRAAAGGHPGVLAQERGDDVASRHRAERAVRRPPRRLLGRCRAPAGRRRDPEQLDRVGAEDPPLDLRRERRVAEALLERRRDLEGPERRDLILRRAVPDAVGAPQDAVGPERRRAACRARGRPRRGRPSRRATSSRARRTRCRPAPMPASRDAAHEPVDAAAVRVVRRPRVRRPRSPSGTRRSARSGLAAAAGPMSTGEANGLPPDRPLCTATIVDAGLRARAAGTARPTGGADGSWSSRNQPPGRVRVHLPRAQVVGRGDLGHRRQRRVERADVGDGVALDQHAVVAAQLGGQGPAALHRLDRQRVGVADDRDGRDRRRPPCRCRRARGRASTRPRSSRCGRLTARRLREAGAPLAGLEEVGLHVDDDVGVGSAGRRAVASRGTVDDVVPWTVASASSGSVAAVAAR